MTVIPWFLIPGRPYPIQVYLHACSLYSSNPKIGQRGAAEATRAKFDLKTFSHSTVCRSFRSFEQARKLSLENRFGEKLKPCDAETPLFVGVAAKVGTTKEDNSHSAGRFPSAIDTAARRKYMTKFFPNFLFEAKIGIIESISLQFVENWHKKSMVLLI